ncbi:hypothetical protein SAMN02745673_01182 [Marinactinospora thermotolerans DSM 45154]|uniref:Uncharacterized protein n=1 Tax=Marinactinospora thermotolerans DSM 45154 TaxID=1122192 RepID=A0A1T4MXZ6_9ACTN|nr:hypothetical protein SAMN02745673_01182 [Marinactinospora thermotolerans DSM 45154]
MGETSGIGPPIAPIHSDTADTFGNFATVPTRDHEILIQMFRNAPSLAPALLNEALGMRIPDHSESRVEPGDLTDCEPTEYRADAVVTLRSDGPVLAVVVEIQRGRDPGKRLTWPVYLATVRARLNCPAVLLVLCPDESTATWCGSPIDMGHPGWVLTPLAVGPDTIPALTDPERAVRSPELAVLSALAHGEDPRVLDALEHSLRSIDDARMRLYTDYVLAALPETARKYLEELMATGTYEYQSDFARKYVAEGKAESVLAVLSARDIPVTDEARQRITTCTDLDLLDTWLRRAATAHTTHDIFG